MEVRRLGRLVDEAAVELGVDPNSEEMNAVRACCSRLLVVFVFCGGVFCGVCGVCGVI